MRCAKIVCTIGPACSDAKMIEALVLAGMNCARLNFSHGTHEAHAKAAETIRAVAARHGRAVALLGDLSGPKMRVGKFGAGPIMLVPGAPFTLTTRDVVGDATQASVTYQALPNDAKPGDAVLLDDGLLRLRVDRVKDSTDVVCVVEVGGPLSDHKGLNIPGATLSAPALTPKDEDDLAFGVEKLHVDYLALSFVRRPDDVRQAQRLAGSTPVIAKIEKPEAITNLEAILDVADGAMVARGDLGVELGAEKVPLVQKRIIKEVNRRGKTVITATQMLDSMIRNPRPTRAEAADVANAVLDGTDALMLSGETASGAYPIESVKMMDLIIREVERESVATTQVADPNLAGEWGFANAAARAAAILSYALPLKAIVAFTRDGRTAHLLSDYRPRAPIVAITSHPEIASRLALEWGVLSYVEVPPDDFEEAQRIATSVLVRQKLCEQGDAFALVLGSPTSSGTNTVKLHRL